MSENHDGGGMCPAHPPRAGEIMDATALAAGGYDAATGALELAESLPRFAQQGGLATGILGLPLSVWGLINGGREVACGNTSQGVLDLGASALGAGSSFTGMVNAAGAFSGGWAPGTSAAAMAGAATPLALGALGVGLGAYGNEYARERGWYGQNADGTNATIFGSVGNEVASGWGQGTRAGRNLLGDTWAGRALGWGLGATRAAELGVVQSGWNAGAAMWGGVRRIGDGVGSLFDRPSPRH